VAALVLTLPSVAVTVVFVQMVRSQVWRVWRSPAFDQPLLSAFNAFLLFSVLVGGFVALLLWLAFLNHRTADRSIDRISGQVVSIASYVATGLAVLMLAGL
jgi:hypothetical protein